MNLRKFKIIFRSLYDKNARFFVKSKLGLCNSVSDEEFLTRIYRFRMGKDLNLENPKTFNEKLQWLKLHDRKPEYTTMVDKYEVKKYVADIIGEEYIIPTLGVWDNVEDIEFDKLPNQFVLKCTHDSGSIVICKDKSKLDFEAAKKKLKKGLKKNLFWYGREWPYKNVKPRIIAEEYLSDTKTNDLYDYKFFCFGGTVRCFKVDFDRFIEHHANYYNREGNILKFGEAELPPIYDKKINISSNIDKMMELSEMLAAQNPFLRADFYDANGKIYFGELTFFPASGFGKFTSEDWDLKLGEWIQLPDKESWGGKAYLIITKELLCVLRVSQDDLSDYKVLCFNGEPKIVEVHKGRFNGQHTADNYDIFWNKTDIEQYDLPKTNELMPKPAFLEEMLYLSRLLSKNLIHVRVDWYFTNNRLYFGELTFYDGSGYNQFCGNADEFLGSLIKLPIK